MGTLSAIYEANVNHVRNYVFDTIVSSGDGIFTENYTPARDGFATFTIAVKDNTVATTTAVTSFVPYVKITDGTDTYIAALNCGTVIGDGTVYSFSVPVVGPYLFGSNTIRDPLLSYNFSVDKELEIAYAVIQEAQ